MTPKPAPAWPCSDSSRIIFCLNRRVLAVPDRWWSPSAWWIHNGGLWAINRKFGWKDEYRDA